MDIVCPLFVSQSVLIIQVSWQDQRGSARTTLTYEDRRIVDDPRFSVLRPTTREWPLQIREVRWEDQGQFFCAVNTETPKYKQVSLHVKGELRVIECFLFQIPSSDVVLTDINIYNKINIVTILHKYTRGNALRNLPPIFY